MINVIVHCASSNIRVNAAAYIGFIAIVTAAIALSFLVLWPPNSVLIGVLLVGAILPIVGGFVMGCTDMFVSRIARAMGRTDRPSDRGPSLLLSRSVVVGRAVIAIPYIDSGVFDGPENLRRALRNHAHIAGTALLTIAVLSDYRDSASEREPRDDGYLSHMTAVIDGLNLEFAGQSVDFVLLQRNRVWSARQQCWMGRERKRGKLHDLNRLILEGDHETFGACVGNIGHVREAKQVLVMDADNRLAPGALHHLRILLDDAAKRVVFDDADFVIRGGHALVQPRIYTQCPVARSTLYALMHDDTGGAFHDVLLAHDRSTNFHQLAFGESSYSGKAIYDVALYEKALAGKLPEDAVLSHDILEGCYLRCRLTAEASVYEDALPDHAAAMRRRHRWTRGDWQNLLFLLRRPWRLYRASPFSLSSQIRVVENVRVSLLPILLILTLILVDLADRPAWGTVIVLMQFIGVTICGVFALSIPANMQAHDRIALTGHRLLTHFGRALFSLTFLAADALNTLSAVATSTFRMMFSGKRTLEWNSSEGDSMQTGFRSIATPAPWWGSLFAICLLATHSSGVQLRVFCYLWLVAPLVSWLAAMPRNRSRLRIGKPSEFRSFGRQR